VVAYCLLFLLCWQAHDGFQKLRINNPIPDKLFSGGMPSLIAHHKGSGKENEEEENKKSPLLHLFAVNLI